MKKNTKTHKELTASVARSIATKYFDATPLKVVSFLEKRITELAKDGWYALETSWDELTEEVLPDADAGIPDRVRERVAEILSIRGFKIITNDQDDLAIDWNA